MVKGQDRTLSHNGFATVVLPDAGQGRLFLSCETTSKDDAGDVLQGVADMRALVHGHFHYADLVDEFLERLSVKLPELTILFVTTTREDQAHIARDALTELHKRDNRTPHCPNAGRDIGAFLTGLSMEDLQPYNVIAHVHGKKSPHIGQAGEEWRRFLWDHLLGGPTAAADVILVNVLRQCIAWVSFLPKNPTYVAGTRTVPMARLWRHV